MMVSDPGLGVVVSYGRYPDERRGRTSPVALSGPAGMARGPGRALEFDAEGGNSSWVVDGFVRSGRRVHPPQAWRWVAAWTTALGLRAGLQSTRELSPEFERTLDERQVE